MQDRILAIVTGVGPHRYSGAIGSVASGFPDLGWSVETLHPLVLVSRPLDEEAAESCRRLFEFCSARADLNVVAAIGSVKYGTIGGGARFAYGSVGEIISTMVEASAAVAPSKIVLNQPLCEYLKCSRGEQKVSIGDQVFSALKR